MRCRQSPVLWSRCLSISVSVQVWHTWHACPTYCVPLQQQGPAVAAPAIAPSCAFLSSLVDSIALIYRHSRLYQRRCTLPAVAAAWFTMTVLVCMYY